MAIFLVLSLILSVLIVYSGELSLKRKLPKEKILNPEESDWEDLVRQARKEGTVIFATWWGEAFYTEVAKRFYNEYGIRVELLIQDLESIVHRIINDKGTQRGNIDIFMGGYAGNVQTIVEAEVLSSGMKSIPGWSNLDIQARTYQKNMFIEDRMIPIYRNQVAFLYNPQKILNPPRSWEAFNHWLKENPGRFAFSALKGGSGEAFKHSVVYHLTGGSELYRTGAVEVQPENVRNWDRAWEWFRAMSSCYVLSDSNHDSLSRIESGEVWITPAYVDDTLIAMNSGLLSRELQLYIPDFGLFRGSDAAGILKNAPHRAAAYLFLSYLISPEIQELMMNMMGADSIRTDLAIRDNPLLSADERLHAIDHTDPVYYIYLASEFQKEVLNP
jgi:putative spermidine/putrescine transport system substrate-binding protein